MAENMDAHNLWMFVRDYLMGENTEGHNQVLMMELAVRGVKYGDRILRFTCPRCKRPLYYLGGFGPACSGERGGCGLKAPRGKRAPFDK